jgi:hypothetical protein
MNLQQIQRRVARQEPLGVVARLAVRSDRSMAHSAHQREDIVGPLDRPSRRTGQGRDPDSGSFRRIVDVPFEPCVAAIERLLDDGPDGGLHLGRSRLRGPLVDDRDWGTVRIEVCLARRWPRRGLRMRLDIDCWSSSPASTAFELTPCEPGRLTAGYFRAGHGLLDSLIHSLQVEWDTRAFHHSTPVSPQEVHRRRAREVGLATAP